MNANLTLNAGRVGVAASASETQAGIDRPRTLLIS